MSAPTTATEFMEMVRRSGLLTDAAIHDHFGDDAELPEEPTACAAALVKAQLLTPFQARLLLTGKHSGFVLGPYKILSPLGQGGMGAVYLAEHTTLGRSVALKTLPHAKAQDRLTVERFKREARAAAALDHPNIVKVFDVLHVRGVHFMAMEYVRGKDLQTLIKEHGPLHYAAAVSYILQAAAGLQHAHDKGIVHRDVKPANLMLSKDGAVKLLDMGLARSFEASDQLTEQLDKGSVVGTADFVSPEQALGQGQDHRGDIYSLGATLFALIAGAPPFKGHTTQLLMQHQMTPPPRLSKALKAPVPAGLDDVIAKMMAKAPRDRHQSVDEVIAALTPFVSTEPVPVPAAQTDTIQNIRGDTKTKVGSRTRIAAQKRKLAELRRAKRRWAAVAGVLAVALGLGGWLVAGTSRSAGGGSAAAPPPGAGGPPAAPVVPAADRAPEGAANRLFARDNLMPWCVVPFDSKKRTPAQRVEMLQRLGFKKYAYDWRAEQLPTFDEEVGLLKKAGIELTAVWFPPQLDADARTILGVIEKHGVRPQLWVTVGEPAGADQRQKVAAAAATVRPLAAAAERLGCAVALYNHSGWSQDPANQIELIDALGLKSVGIVYCQHHGHAHLDRFAELFPKMRPHLLAVAVNGMNRNGPMALPLGQGEADAKLLKVIVDSGYTGPVGVLGHTEDDVEERLSDNLDGLAWLVPQLTGQPAGPKPRYRTGQPVPAGAPTAPLGGWVAAGRPEYRTPPLTVECRVKVNSKAEFNIVVASDPKESGAHWELFTAAGTGQLTAFLPGVRPDHVRTEADICDKQWHTVAMQYEANRVRLYLDGRLVADQEVTSAKVPAVPGGLGFAKLVGPAQEGVFGLNGELDRVRISKGVVAPGDKELTAGEATLGLWTFGDRAKPAPDASQQKNDAKPSALPIAGAGAPPPAGPNFAPIDPALKAVVIDRTTDEAYMAVKADGDGRVFVGGREAVFVFEPDGKGGFGARRELFKLPPDSIVIGLEFRGDDLYALAAHGLYLVPGGRVNREALAPKRILWGLPLDYHVSFHCLAWGPDGDLYLDHGDPLLNTGDWERHDHWGHWTLFAGPKGEPVPYTGTGAVLKVRPDGSNPRAVARGLRGPVGLAFDPQWNLFTNDNDHEGRPDLFVPSRLLHVSPQADFGWPRGWMAAKSPDRADLLESVHPALGRGVPCDLAYYDEPALPALRGSLLMCRWDRFAVTRYPLRPAGASFTADEAVFAQGANQCRPTGVAVDAAGRVFVTNLYLGGNVVSPNCPSELVVIAPTGAPAGAAFNEHTAPADALWAALNGASWEARRRAHAELIRRGAPLAQAAERLGRVRDTEPAAAHLPWLAAIAGDGGAKLAELAAAADKPVLRLHALRALAAFPALKPPARVFADALGDSSPAVQLAGLEGFLGTALPFPADAVGALAGSGDPVLRQTAATLLARRGAADDLERHAKSGSARVRLGAVLALGTRLTVPLPDAAAPAGVKLHMPASGGFFNGTLRFADAAEPVELARLGPIGSYTVAQRWAAAPRTTDEERGFKLLLAALDDADDAVRLQSAHYLGWLRDPRSEPGVARVRAEGRTRGLSDRPAVPVKQVWRVGRLPAGAVGEAIERGPIDLTAPVGAAGAAWESTAAGTDGVAVPAGKGFTYAYFRLQSRPRQPALLSGLPADAALWHNGRPVAPEKAATFVLDLQPGGNDVLVRTAGDAPLAAAVRARENVSVALPEKTDGAVLAERLKAAAGAAAVAPEFLALDWATEGRKGDAAKGRTLFGSLGCAKCHAVAKDQTGGGAPSLAEAGKRFTAAHLAESILLPDRLVADEFRNTRIVTLDSKTLVGLVVRESATELELLLPDTTRTVVKVADIEVRKPTASSPMPAGLVKTPDELRNLIAYLLSDAALPP